jgi:hypothetical protein
MNEAQAVLDFFSKKENLSLGLSVAELMDELREKQNSSFWLALQQRLNAQPGINASEWQVHTTEDRNAADALVGLQCKLCNPQERCLFPMMEQQYLGGVWRIYMGLMWQTPPSAEHLILPAVATLKQAMTDTGFGSNDNFLAWQWTRLYPRRSEFLLRYSRHPEQLLDEVEALFNSLLIPHREQIAAANAALSTAPRSMPVSLDQLRRKRED